MISIQTPQRLLVQGDGLRSFGAKQTWYRRFFQRMGGCGPTTGSHIAWYLAQREGCKGLCLYEGNDKEGFLQLMEDMWEYITPGLRGVDTPEQFAQGMEAYGRDRDVPLRCDILKVPAKDGKPSLDVMIPYLSAALERDLPVAFLNLNNGNVHGLDSWHWVTVVGIDPKTGRARIYDQGRQITIDLAQWLDRTALGGGFVVVEPAGS